MKRLIEKFMDVLSCDKEEAEYYANEHIKRIRTNNPGATKSMAIYSLNNTLS